MKSRNSYFKRCTPNYERCLSTRTKLYGEKSFAAADTYNNIAMVYEAMGDFNAAFDQYQASKEIYESTEGENCLQVFTLNNNMGNLCKDFNKYNQALGFFNKAKSTCAELQDFDRKYEYTNALNSNINICMAKIKPRHLGIRII